jgi:hypothetical protein
MSHISYVAYLFQESPFLHDVGYSLHLDTFLFVDVFKSVERLGLFVLHHSDLRPTGYGWDVDTNLRDRSTTHLAECPFPNASQQEEVEQIDFPIEIDSLYVEQATLD